MSGERTRCCTCGQRVEIQGKVTKSYVGLDAKLIAELEPMLEETERQVQAAFVLSNDEHQNGLLEASYNRLIGINSKIDEATDG
jgi:hypothetical protein